jgi:glycosyltransferase involved in cell wall biosynthesis
VSAAVAIDGRAAVRREIGGVERVARAMADELPRVAPGRYRVVVPPARLAHRAGHAWEQLALPLIARGAELIYCPANLAPLAGRRNVVVIHDAAALRHPEWYSRAYAAYQRRLLPLVARRARQVLTVSEFSRADLATALGLDPERIAVVPNGVDERFSPGADPEPSRAAHGLRRAYALVVGTRIARKNLDALGEAARLLSDEGIELVAAGSGRGYMRQEAGAAARPLGYVAEEHLPGLYAGASAVLMPSLYEGFGLPCLEAMACGTPVAASDRGALPETCGGAALHADPEDPVAFAAAALRAATDEPVRTRLRAAGLERARQFTWRRAARATDAIVGRLLGG